MALFNKFKKSKKGDETMAEEKKTTLEQVREAYQNLDEDDKKAFHQSIADRIHESIGAQEADDGDRDSQSAEDREHEALGEEHAHGEGDVSELHEEDEKPDKLDVLEKRIAELEEAVRASKRDPKKVDDDKSDRLSRLARKWEN